MVLFASAPSPVGLFLISTIVWFGIFALLALPFPWLVLGRRIRAKATLDVQGIALLGLGIVLWCSFASEIPFSANRHVGSVAAGIVLGWACAWLNWRWIRVQLDEAEKAKNHGCGACERTTDPNPK